VMEQLKLINKPDTFLPILILTADISVESKQKALSGGANDFLTKPFDLVEVGLRIKNLLYTAYLQQQLKDQNQELEKKVNQRTYELEQRNHEFLKARDKAEASDGLKTAFMQNISHEIRTPLNGILGFGELLAEADASVEERQLYLDMLRLSSTRLTNTITDYMDISLIVTNNLEVIPTAVDVCMILHEMKDKFQGLCDAKHLYLSLSIPENQKSLILHTDQELFQKIISHLMDNAVKFTLQGGIVLGFTIQSEKVEFYVKDTGIGIDEDAQELIFESFMQVDTSNTREHEGSGLGLTIAQGMTEMINGEIHLHSVKGKGSTFSFTLPNISEPVNTVVSNKFYINEVIVPLLKNLKVVIAEDDDISAIYLKEIIKKYCKEILHARTGEEAVKICLKNDDIDFVLMDIKMPGMDGYEAIRQIRRFNKDVIIIVQTAYALAGDIEKALASGCNDYISKPIHKIGLLELMEKHRFQSLNSKNE